MVIGQSRRRRRKLQRDRRKISHEQHCGKGKYQQGISSQLGSVEKIEGRTRKIRTEKKNFFFIGTVKVLGHQWKNISMKYGARVAGANTN